MDDIIVALYNQTLETTSQPPCRSNKRLGLLFFKWERKGCIRHSPFTLDQLWSTLDQLWSKVVVFKTALYTVLKWWLFHFHIYVFFYAWITFFSVHTTTRSYDFTSWDYVFGCLRSKIFAIFIHYKSSVCILGWTVTCSVIYIVQC